MEDTWSTGDPELDDLIEDHDLDEETADRVRDIMDELGVSEDEALELEEEGLE